MNLGLRVKTLQGARTPSCIPSRVSNLVLYSNESIVIPAKAWRGISTGLIIIAPAGYELWIRSHEELARRGVVVMSWPKEGEVTIVGLHNLTTKPWFINHGDMIAFATLSPTVPIHLVLEESST